MLHYGMRLSCATLMLPLLEPGARLPLGDRRGWRGACRLEILRFGGADAGLALRERR